MIELTAPVERLAATITSTQQTGVTRDELGHTRSSDGPAGTVAGLLRPRGGIHREQADSGNLIYAAAAPEPVAAESAVPLRGGPRAAAMVEIARAPGDAPAGSVARLEAPAPDRPPVTAPGSQSSTGSPVGSPLSSRSAVTGAPRMPAAPSELPRLAVRSLQPSVHAETVAPSGRPTSMPVGVADSPNAPTRTDIASSAPPSPAAPSSATPSSSGASGSSSTSVGPPLVERSPLVGSTRIVRRIGEPMRERPASMVSTSSVSTGSPSSGGREAPPLAVPSGLARLGQTGTVASRPHLPEPGIVPDRVARAVASIDVPSSVVPSSDVSSGDVRSTQRADAGGVTRAAPPSTRPLVGSRRSIQRLADAPTSAALLSTPRSGGAETDDRTVPVRWGPIPRRQVQRAPEGVPADLRSELEPVLGTPLADVKVHRDAETGEAARQLSAKAFTAGGEVFLPEWHGSTSSGEARTILTHELTHVAQQRRLGAELPDEASPAGANLESEALAMAGQGPAVPARPVASRRSGGGSQRLVGEQPSPPARAVRAVPPRSLDGSTGVGMSPMEVVARVQSAATAAGIASTPPSGESARPGGPPSPPTTAAPNASSVVSAGSAQRLPDDLANTPTSNSSTADADASSSDAPAQLDELARRLYPRFRTRLRQELLADRERAGRLFDAR